MNLKKLIHGYQTIDGVEDADLINMLLDFVQEMSMAEELREFLDQKIHLSDDEGAAESDEESEEEEGFDDYEEEIEFDDDMDGSPRTSDDY